MNTLTEIKNNYAIEHAYKDWKELQEYHKYNPRGIEDHMNEICIRAQKAALEKAAESRNKFFRTAEMRDLEMQLTKEEISYSRMIEIINEKAYNLYRASITNPENLIR